MENLALIESFSEFKDEKLIDRVILIVILERFLEIPLKGNLARMKTSTSLSILTKETLKYGGIELLSRMVR